MQESKPDWLYVSTESRLSADLPSMEYDLLQEILVFGTLVIFGEAPEDPDPCDMMVLIFYNHISAKEGGRFLLRENSM